jgi:DNA-binding protein HU-beta
MMTKTQVVSHLAEKAGIQKKVAAAAVAELIGLAIKETKTDGQFVIPGLGKAVKANRKARTGRNPQKGSGHQDSRQDRREVPPRQGV